MEQDMRTRTNPKKNLEQRNMRHRMKDQTREKYHCTFTNWRSQTWDGKRFLEQKKQLLAPAFLWEPAMDRHVTVTHQQGSTQNIEKVTQQQFFSFFSCLKWGFYTQIRIDLSCWFHCFTRWRACRECLRLLPLPWAPGSDVTPGRGGGGVTWESWSGCAARFSKSSFSTPLRVFTPGF